MGCFNALGTIAFAYGGHNVVLEIQVQWPLISPVVGQLHADFLLACLCACSLDHSLACFVPFILSFLLFVLGLFFIFCSSCQPVFHSCVLSYCLSAFSFLQLSLCASEANHVHVLHPSCPKQVNDCMMQSTKQSLTA